MKIEKFLIMYEILPGRNPANYPCSLGTDGNILVSGTLSGTTMATRGHRFFELRVAGDAVPSI
jgi:hypothetical protein